MGVWGVGDVEVLGTDRHGCLRRRGSSSLTGYLPRVINKTRETALVRRGLRCTD